MRGILYAKNSEFQSFLEFDCVWRGRQFYVKIANFINKIFSLDSTFLSIPTLIFWVPPSKPIPSRIGFKQNVILGSFTVFRRTTQKIAKNNSQKLWGINQKHRQFTNRG